jgi:hypothetical protein
MKRSGRLQVKPSKDFWRVVRIWQKGDISTAEAARQIGISRYAFYCWLPLNGITEFPEKRNWTKRPSKYKGKQPGSAHFSIAPDDFAHYYAQWKAGKMNYGTVLKKLHIGRAKFYRWVVEHEKERTKGIRRPESGSLGKPPSAPK